MAEKAERRDLYFKTLDEATADIERLAAGNVRTTGNHSFEAIINHLALSLDMSTGKVQAPPPPWYMKLMLTFAKSFVLKDKPLMPGIKLPAASENFFWPDQEFDLQQTIKHFKEAVEYYQTKGPLKRHAVFGDMTIEQNLSLNCRHCAMHLSFVHPA